MKSGRTRGSGASARRRCKHSLTPCRWRAKNQVGFKPVTKATPPEATTASSRRLSDRVSICTFQTRICGTPRTAIGRDRRSASARRHGSPALGHPRPCAADQRHRRALPQNHARRVLSHRLYYASKDSWTASGESKPEAFGIFLKIFSGKLRCHGFRLREAKVRSPCLLTDR
jgi:hypothetical protein